MRRRGCPCEGRSFAYHSCAVCGWREESLKTNALLTLVHGFASVHRTMGRTERRSGGGILKYRRSYNHLSITFRHAGEKGLAYGRGIDGPRSYTAQYHPGLLERLTKAQSATCDFSSGCQNAYGEKYKAELADKYEWADGVLLT